MVQEIFKRALRYSNLITAVDAPWIQQDCCWLLHPILTFAKNKHVEAHAKCPDLGQEGCVGAAAEAAHLWRHEGRGAHGGCHQSVFSGLHSEVGMVIRRG